MNPTIVGIIVFTCTFAGSLFGIWLRRVLPDHLFDDDSMNAVKSSIGLISTMTALILSLVTSTAKTSFDSVDSAVKVTSAQLIALDRVLARYGSETGPIRQTLTRMVKSRIEAVWPQGLSRKGRIEILASRVWLLDAERLPDTIQGLKPQDNAQRILQKRALDLVEVLLQDRWLVSDSSGKSIPAPFLAVLLSWLTIIFTSFGLFARANRLVLTVLLVCALSVASALFLILELDGPFDGVLQVSPDPMIYTLDHINR